jgi:predicted  nucleic acid-binding Zn-ribbon protein
MATIEMDLKDVLAKIDQRLDRMEQKLEALPRMEAEISQLKDDVRDIKGRANAQIWALIIAVIGAVIATVIKSGFFQNP